MFSRYQKTQTIPFFLNFVFLWFKTWKNANLIFKMFRLRDFNSFHDLKPFENYKNFALFFEPRILLNVRLPWWKVCSNIDFKFENNRIYTDEYVKLLSNMISTFKIWKCIPKIYDERRWDTDSIPSSCAHLSLLNHICGDRINTKTVFRHHITTKTNKNKGPTENISKRKKK